MGKARIGIVGATGYSGQELLKLLVKHPFVELTYVSSRAEKGKPLTDYYPFLPPSLDAITFSDVNLDEMQEKCDLVFFATPSAIAKDLAPVLYEKGVKVIDISGDFRLSGVSDYQAWYGYEHPFPSLLNEVVYCIPEINREQAKGCNFISNPGCYPTSILLALVPVLKSITPKSTIVIDSKSGATGAGKKASVDLMYCEVNESFKAYAVGGKHKHTPEIEKYLEEWSSYSEKVLFTPHLLPMERGILSTIYLNNITEDQAEKAASLLDDFYKNETFVKFKGKKLPKTSDVAHTNQCHIGYEYDKRSSTLILVSVIDNVIKGASGQALQNMNIVLGMDERLGLC